MTLRCKYDYRVYCVENSCDNCDIQERLEMNNSTIKRLIEAERAFRQIMDLEIKFDSGYFPLYSIYRKKPWTSHYHCFLQSDWIWKYNLNDYYSEAEGISGIYHHN